MPMPGGRARGNPVQNFSEKIQKFPSTDLKNILYFHTTTWPSFICHMNLGLAPLGLDFGIFGTQCECLAFFRKIRLFNFKAKKLLFPSCTLPSPVLCLFLLLYRMHSFIRSCETSLKILLTFLPLHSGLISLMPEIQVRSSTAYFCHRDGLK